MKTSKPSPKTGRRRVTFSLDYPGAESVFLLGDFNQWNPNSHPMKKDASGVWKKIAMLYPGRYEYRFQVDGQWRNDPRNQHTSLNSFGTYNNVMVVESL